MPQDYALGEDQDLDMSIHVVAEEFDSFNFIENTHIVNSSFLKDIAILLNSSNFEPIQILIMEITAKLMLNLLKMLSVAKRMTSLSNLINNWTRF